MFLWLYYGVEDAERKPSFLRSRDGTVLVQLSPSLSEGASDSLRRGH
jgi:hypothetical protein